jgi:hypothetical protein
MEIAKLTWNAGKVTSFDIHKVGERMAEKFLSAFKGFDEPVWIKVEDLPNYGVKVEPVKPDTKPETKPDPKPEPEPSPKPRGRKPSSK